MQRLSCGRKIRWYDKTIASERLVAECLMQGAVSGHFPSPDGAAGGLRQLAHDAQPAQVPQAALWVVPALPEATADVAANPRLRAEDVAAVLGQPVIRPPASDIGAPAVAQLLTAQTLTASPQFPRLVFHSFHTLRGRFDPPFTADPK